MVNAFQEIISYNGNDPISNLRKLGIENIFSPLVSIYISSSVLGNVIKFIVYGYTMGSPKIGISKDRKKEKLKIMNDLGLAEEIHFDNLILLKNKVIVEVISEWLREGDNQQIEYVLTLKEIYLQQKIASVSDIKKSDGINIDFDQKYRCIEYCEKLKKMIKDAESELQQNDPKFREVYSEIKSVKSKKTMGLETTLKDSEN